MITTQIDEESELLNELLVSDNISSFPSTRYYGSKKRLLKWIFENTKKLRFNSVLDAFGGTSSVSLLFKAMGKQVHYNDIFKFNTTIASALLSSDKNVNLLKMLNFFENITPVEGTISHHYKDIFYTNEENNWLDGAAISINSVKSLKERNFLWYCLLQSCLQKRPYNLFHRANLYMRLNTNINRNFGNMTTWETSFKQLAKSNAIELSNCTFNTNVTHSIFNPQDAMNLPTGYDLVYVDPPYVSNNTSSTDNYLKKYHFLEGLVNYSNWGNLIENHYKIKQIKHPYDKRWENKSTFKDMLYGFINKHKNSIIVLSYVDNAIPSIDELQQHFTSHFSEVMIDSYSLSHALAKTKRNEYLIIGVP